MNIHQSEKVLPETAIVFFFLSVALELSFVQLQVICFERGSTSPKITCLNKFEMLHCKFKNGIYRESLKRFNNKN